MFNLFLPRKTKKVLAESELIQGSLQRNRVYAQDILNARDLEIIHGFESRYPALLKSKDVTGLEELNAEVMKLGKKLFPPSPWDNWRENVEVFVVAAIMALAIRTFFLQPFKIPTGSMEPTLFGIEPVLTDTPPPNVLVRAFDFIIRGKSYGNVVTQMGGQITRLESGSFTIWLEYTDVHLQDAQGHTEVDRIWIRPQDVMYKLGVFPAGIDSRTGLDHTKIYKPGETIANFTTQTGDQVLVDKVSYNFHPPRRGDVFIFKTAGIPSLANENPGQDGSQDFIKRCVGFAGDLVEVKPPALYINGALATGASAFEKEFKQLDHYPGYSLLNYMGGEGTGITKDTNRPYNPFDPDNNQTYYVPADCYWAMGDNSPYSKDSRYWGGVPRQNLVGRGYFVFWPFTSRWGWIK